MKRLFHWFTSKLPSLRATRYDAAITTGENARHWALADGLSPDRSMSSEVRRTLRERSRYEVSNNAYARGMVVTIAEDVIGTGPRPRLQTGSDQLNRRLQRDFLLWSAAISLPEKLRAMAQAKIIDGEAFAVLINNPRLGHPIQLDLKLIEADRVSTPPGSSPFAPARGARHFADGIVLDAADNPLYYTIARCHPGAAFSETGKFSGATLFDTIPAGDMIHWYRLDRPEQHRGLPELTAALPLFAQLRRYTLAVLASAETAADFAAVIYTDTPAGGESIQATPFDVVTLEKRMATTLPDGWKLGQLKAEQPVTNYPQFKREILGEIGRVLRVPINIMTGDSSQHGYASGRLDYQSYQRAVKIEQDRCASSVLKPLFRAWLKEYTLACPDIFEGKLLDQRNWPELCSPAWFWDGFEHVDPNKEANAQARRLKNRTSTLAAEYARVGKDWEEEIGEYAREKQRLRELGLLKKKPASQQ